MVKISMLFSNLDLIIKILNVDLIQNKSEIKVFYNTMQKLLYSLSFLILTCYCHAQKLTRITSEGDTSSTIYAFSSAGDSLIVDKTTVFKVIPALEGAFFMAGTDTLFLNFQDQAKMVMVNKDKYWLYPKFYAQFKKAVLIKHSVIAILNLLADNIGDYPIEAALPLILFTPQTTKQIRLAKILTQRSQANLSDDWDCIYHYNKSGRLTSVTAVSPEETRFSKKITYAGSVINNIKTHRNLETRQITDKTITYSGNSILKWHEMVLETGKNREHELTVSLKKSLK